MSLLKSEHPARESLFEYAEQLESGQVPFGSPASAHIRDCERCAEEVESMRRSLSLATFATRTIEPSVALEASTILAMKSQRQTHRKQVRQRAAKSAAFAAAFIVTVSVSLSSSTAPEDSGVAKFYPRAGQSSASISYEALLTQSPEELLLEPAIMQSYWQPASRWELSQSRALEELDKEIDEALAAIQSNPALVRAGVVISANRETKRQTLKSLYAQRDL